MKNDDTLSALMDDEAEDLALRRMLRDLPQQPETLVRWRRYQLVREVLSGGRPRGDVDLAARVRAALEVGGADMAEVTGSDYAGHGQLASQPRDDTGIGRKPGAEVAGLRGAWRRAAGSFAVAASVAAVVFVGGQQLLWVDADTGVIGALPSGVVNTRGAVPVQASFGARNPGNSALSRANDSAANGYINLNSSMAAPVLQPADRTAYRELARQRLRRYSLEHAEHAALNTPAGLLPYARVPQTAVAEQ